MAFLWDLKSVETPEEAEALVDKLVEQFGRTGLSTLRDRYQWNLSVLHAAAANPCVDTGAQLIRALCAAGADVTARDANCNQPLHIAVQLSGGGICVYGEGIERVLAGQAAPPHVQALLDAGAPVDGYNNAGWQPIHLAIRTQAHAGTMRGVLAALLAAGADPRAPGIDPSGAASWPPIHIAAYQCRSGECAAEAIRTLVEAGAAPRRCAPRRPAIFLNPCSPTASLLLALPPQASPPLPRRGPTASSRCTLRSVRPCLRAWLGGLQCPARVCSPRACKVPSAAQPACPFCFVPCHCRVACPLTLLCNAQPRHALTRPAQHTTLTPAWMPQKTPRQPPA